MAEISFIVAVAAGGVIGREGGMAWHLPAELAYFRKTTSGHPIIMGRKTYESIGKALPGRVNIVITRDKDYQAEGCVVVTSVEEAIEEAKQAPGGDKEIFIIGGQAIFELAMPLATKIYLTKVDAEITGDKFFKYEAGDWLQTFSEKHSKDSENPYDWEYTILERKH